MNRCPACGKVYGDEARFCTRDGSKLIAVVEKGTLAGVFSERDIMSRVVAKGLNPDSTEVSDVMSRERPDNCCCPLGTAVVR